MPFGFFTFHKGYRALPSSSPSSGESTSLSGSRVGNVLYDPPIDSTGGLVEDISTVTASSASSSTVCLPGTPRHGPLIDLDDGSDVESDEETNRIVSELREELTTEEFNETVNEFYQFRDEHAALDRPAAEREQRPGSSLDGGACVCDKDKRREELLKFFGADEDAVELKGELKVDDREGTLLETLFNSDMKGGRYGGDRSSNEFDDSWCTTDDIAGSPSDEAGPFKTDRGTVVGTKSVLNWLTLRNKLRPAEETGRTAPPTALTTEPSDLANEEAVAWAEAIEQPSERHSDRKSSTNTEPSSIWSANKVLGAVGNKELDTMFAQLEMAEEGRSTELGPVKKVRHYGDDTSDSVECVVVDRPSLDFLDRLGALEGANLREPRGSSL